MDRVNATSKVLSSMKTIKMLGFTARLSDMIQGMRVRELNLSKRYRYLSVTNNALVNIPPIISPLLTFASYAMISKAKNEARLDVSQAFTSLALLYLINSPVALFIIAIPQYFVTLGCFSRIQDFVSQDDWKDFRSLMKPNDPNEISTSILTPGSPDIELSRFQISRARYVDFMVVIKNGCFAWGSNTEPILHDVNLSIQKSSLTFIIGPTRSGKSTLLKAILGETMITSGTVTVDSLEATFCDQTAWLRNGTLRDNILGCNEYEAGWYKLVIHACALDPDLEVMPNGDSTLIGSKGIALSGGQEQRLAIARAVYARKPLVLLDDVFSALDPATAKVVFYQLLEPSSGLLVKQGSTVILATSSTKNLGNADTLVVVADGRVSQQGKFESLYSSAEGPQPPKSEVQDVEMTGSEAKSTDKRTTTPVQSHSGRESVSACEDQGRSTGDITIFAYYLKSMGRWSLWIFASLVITCASLSGLQSIWLSLWSSATETSTKKRLGYWLGIYASIVVLQSIALVSAVSFLWIKIVPKSANSLHKRLLRTTMEAPLSFFAATDHGSLINRFSQDMRLVDMVLPVAFVNASFMLANSFASVILTIISVKYIAAALPLIFGTLFMIQRFYLRTSRQLRLLEIEAKAPLFADFIESLAGLTIIRAFGWADKLSTRNMKLLDTSQKPYYLLLCIQQWLTLVLDIIVAILAIILVSVAVNVRTKISASFLGVALVNIMGLSQSLTNLVMFWTQLETSLGAISRVRSFVRDTEAEDSSLQRIAIPESWPARGFLSFRNVSVAYGHAPAALNDVSFSLKHGEKLGICGRSGSGKSTLISAIFHMADIIEGEILIDGISTTSVPSQLIRSKIVAVPQEPFFLSDSIRSNADPFGLSTDAQITAVLKKVGLWSIVQQKGGSGVQWSDDMFSNGQRQLFCFARAMLNPGVIVVLDEPTNGLDNDTDAIVQSLIRNEFRDRTIITIAHRLDTLLDYDKIAVLEAGRLVEFGSPATLLEDHESHFSKLLRASDENR